MLRILIIVFCIGLILLGLFLFVRILLDARKGTCTGCCADCHSRCCQKDAKQQAKQ